jgi:hypothetical protein
MLPRSKRARAIAALVALVLCGVFIPPFVTLDRFKARIAGSMSAALGRRVTFQNATLRLLPQPGVDLTNLVIEDDPAFSAEPMIRADEVTAYLRLTALWQGRFEVARLSLTDPSLNLVRNDQGQWNLAGLLERASQVPAAPTTKRRPEARPRFPYIEASAGRINLKLGQEKTAYALSEADFSLWLESENEWHMRLEARPIRTDLNLSDTGLLRVEGTATRGATLRDTALHFTYDWEKAQLGNVTQLIWGRDRGWRGAVEVSGSIAGTPRELLLATRADLSGFQRYDIFAPDALNGEVRCSARLLGDTQTLADINCGLPLGNGDIAARGVVTGLFSDRVWELSVTASAIPASELVRFARHAKKDIPADVNATGTVDAVFTYRRRGGVAAWSTGSGSTTAMRLTARALDPPVEVGAIRFTLGPGPDVPTRPVKKAGGSHPVPPPPMPTPRLTIQPFTVGLGGPQPLNLEGTIDHDTYYLKVTGDEDVQRLVAIAGVLGLRPPQVGAKGDAHLQIALSGEWRGFAAPVVTGNAQLHNVTAELKGLNAPVKVESALLAFSEDGVGALDTSVSFAGSPVTIAGDFHLPRGCSTLLDCPVKFALTSPSLNLDDLNRLLNPRFHSQPWYHFIVGSQQTTGLRRLHAEGRLATQKLIIKSATVNHVSTTITFADGKLTLSNVSADVFGGKQLGTWTADFSGNTPVYSGSGTLDKADVAQLATTMKDNWGAGLVSGTYKFSASGDTAVEIAASAQGELQFDWRNGLLRHVALQSLAPLRVKRFVGTLALRDAKLALDAGKMETPEGIYTVRGSSTFARAIDFTLTGATRSYTVTGTLEKPRVIVPPATEAVLKQ